MRVTAGGWGIVLGRRCCARGARVRVFQEVIPTSVTSRPGPVRSKSSRVFVDGMLSDLRADGWRAGGWVRFWRDAWRRSAEAAAERRSAALETTLLCAL